MQSCVPLPLQKKQLDDLVEKAKDYLLMHGELGEQSTITLCVCVHKYEQGFGPWLAQETWGWAWALDICVWFWKATS